MSLHDVGEAAEGRPPAADWQALALAEIHPVRIAVVKVAASTDQVSPVDLATTLNVPLGTVAYHVRRLVELGVLQQTHTRQRRGAVAHYYRLADGFRA